MRDTLLRIIGHMRWADALVANALTADAQPNADAVRLFAHIAAAEHLWYCRILGTTPEHAVWPTLAPEKAAELAAAQADLFEELVRGADEEGLGRRIAYRNSAGHAFVSPVSEIVIHLGLHGEHHRGQIARLLRAAGREPPYTDYIQYTRRDQ